MNPAYLDTYFFGPFNPQKIPGHSFIITAWNPMDEKLSNEENIKRNAILKNRIGRSGSVCQPITGASKDLTHQEPSFLTNAPLIQVIEWAKAFDQRAIFEIQGGRVTILYLDNERRSVPLGSLTDRWITPNE